MSKSRLQAKLAKRGFMPARQYRTYERYVKRLLASPTESPSFEIIVDPADMPFFRKIVEEGITSYRVMIEDDGLDMRVRNGYRFILDGLESIQFDLEMNFDMDEDSATVLQLQYSEMASLWWEFHSVESESADTLIDKYKAQIVKQIPSDLMFVLLNMAI